MILETNQNHITTYIQLYKNTLLWNNIAENCLGIEPLTARNTSLKIWCGNHYKIVYLNLKIYAALCPGFHCVINSCVICVLYVYSLMYFLVWIRYGILGIFLSYFIRKNVSISRISRDVLNIKHKRVVSAFPSVK